jgi:maltodextrin utilization protein YvdJ
MKKVNSSVNPLQYEIRKRTDKEVYIKLRKNIVELTREDEEGTSTYYEYDEIEVKIPNQREIETYIEANFEALYLSSEPEIAFKTIKELRELLADTIEEVLLV